MFARFDVFTSISVVTATVVGGVGFIGGALIGSTMVPGGLASRALDEISELGLWLALIGGVLVIVVLRMDQDGVFDDEPQDPRGGSTAKLRRSSRRGSLPPSRPSPPAKATDRAAPGRAP